MGKLAVSDLCIGLCGALRLHCISCGTFEINLSLLLGIIPMKRMIGFASAALVFIPIATSAAVDGRICFESQASEPGSPTVYTDYRITYQKGEVATVAGQVCYTNPSVLNSECFAVDGNIHFHNGLMEIDTAGSDRVTLPGVGEVFSFMHGYEEIDSKTLESSGQAVVTYVIDGKSQTVISNYSGSKAVPCPALTPEDKANIALRNKMLRELDRL